jgi:chemotaxis family two-component system sensor kinase Cph1
MSSQQELLNQCETEPIHEIGYIQAYGYILAIDRSSYTVHQASKNVEALFDIPIDDVIGASIDEFFPFSLLEHLEHFVKNAKENQHYSLSFQLRNRPYILQSHIGTEIILLEIEPDSLEHRNDSYYKYANLVDNLSLQIEEASSIEQTCERILSASKALLGFDRTMIYKFGDDGHGEVIAEKADDNKQKYLGLRFPASDIPAQARRLYLINTIRGIWDVNEDPVPIVPTLRESDQKPLDLSFSFLRSVSPVHIQYLKNMGLRASFSISIIVQKQLWGLVLCHHSSEAHRLNIHQRRASIFLGNFLSQKISGIQENLKLKALRQRLKDAVHVISNLASSKDLHIAIKNSRADLLKSLEADDYLLVHGGSSSSSFAEGILPQEWLDSISVQIAGLQDHAFATRSISDAFGLEFHKSLPAGMLVLKLSHGLNEYLILFRKEESENVDWGGKPSKPDENNVLHPRSSFAKWEEEVLGKCKSWSPEEILFAEELRVNIIESILIHAAKEVVDEKDSSAVLKRLKERNHELESNNKVLREEIERLQRMESDFRLNQEVLQAKKELKYLKQIEKGN